MEHPRTFRISANKRHEVGRYRRHQRTASTFLVVLGLVTGACGSAGGVAVSNSTSETAVTVAPGGISLHEVSKIVHQLSSQNGDSSPSDLQYVTTNERSAETMFGEADAGTAEGPTVVLAAAKGSYVAEDSKRPPGQPAPHGVALFVVVNATNGAIMDWGLLDSYPNLATLGTPTPLS